MSYQEISIDAITTKLGFDDWTIVVNAINAASGYIKPSSIEQDFIDSHYVVRSRIHDQYGNSQRTFSYENLKFADVLEHKNTKEVFVNAKVDLNFSQREFLLINDRAFKPSVFFAKFTCPECKRSYKLDCNPARSNIRTSICGKCQKSWLHSFKSYIDNYKKSMLDRHGVEFPIQKKEFLDKKCMTHIKTLGVMYPMQSSVVRENHAKSMFDKYGKDNYFRNLNPYHEWPHNFDKGFVSIGELEVARVCHEIFGSQCMSTLTKKFKIHDQDRWFSPDVYDPATKSIIEFNGDYWHANPEIYDDRKKFRNGSFQDVRRAEERRYEMFKNHVTNVFIVWENCWKNKREFVIEGLRKVKDAINSNSFVQKEWLPGWQP